MVLTPKPLNMSEQMIVSHSFQNRGTRPTIGLLCQVPATEFIGQNHCNLQMWLGVCDAAQAAGVNAVYFAGHELQSPQDDPQCC